MRQLKKRWPKIQMATKAQITHYGKSIFTALKHCRMTITSWRLIQHLIYIVLWCLNVIFSHILFNIVIGQNSIPTIKINIFSYLGKKKSLLNKTALFFLKKHCQMFLFFFKRINNMVIILIDTRAYWNVPVFLCLFQTAG